MIPDFPKQLSSYRGSGGFDREAGGRTWMPGGRVRARFAAIYLTWLVTPTFKTPSLFDGFLLELHLSYEVLQ